MGGNVSQWATVQATRFKSNNEVDRAAEVKAYYEENIREYTLVETAAVGSLVYCLVIGRRDGEAAMHVARTAATGHGGKRWLAISISDEGEASSIENADSCPKRLLSRLSSPTSSQALAWRRRCMLRAAKNAEWRRAQRAGNRV